MTSHPSATTSSGSRAGAPLVPRLVRGALGGLVAGAVFVGVTMWFASTVGDPAQGPLMMISTMALGADAISGGTADPTLGVVIHAVLSIVFGAVFALVVARLPTNGAVALAGTIYGGLLYVINFLVVSPVVFPVFSKRQPTIRTVRPRGLRDPAVIRGFPQRRAPPGAAVHPDSLTAFVVLSAYQLGMR